MSSIDKYITVEDGFLEVAHEELFKDFVASASFPYRLYPTHVDYRGTDPILKGRVERGEISPSNQLSHLLYIHGEDNVSPHFKNFEPIIRRVMERFGRIAPLRAKVNVTFPYPPYLNYEPQMPHVDLQDNQGRTIEHMVFLYYFNDSDGYTYFYDDSYNEILKIEPKQGRAIFFDGSILHAASNPANFPYRFVFNMDFVPEKPSLYFKI